jgi:K+-transporting ATPase ATPase A chain
MFIALLAGTVVLISVLNYVPALALGPVVEHLQMFSSASPR